MSGLTCPAAGFTITFGRSPFALVLSALPKRQRTYRVPERPLGRTISRSNGRDASQAVFIRTQRRDKLFRRHGESALSVRRRIRPREPRGIYSISLKPRCPVPKNEV